jgi:hypothetical protein
MNSSTLYTIIWIAVPFIAALSVYGMLRNRDRSAVTAGCGAIAAGVVVSLAITAIFVISAAT